VPARQPPARARDVRPTMVRVPGGTRLWRVHPRGREDVFETGPHVEPFGGGRFDSNESFRYSFTYLGMEPDTALCERLLRGLPADAAGARLLPRREVAGRQLRAVRLRRDLELLSLRTGPELAGVYADEWLVHCDAAEYPKTRAWGHWLREQVPDAEGFTWASKRNLAGSAVILFGDRCRDAVEWDAGVAPLDLDDEAGAVELRRRLAPYRVTVRPPRRPPAAAGGPVTHSG